jgi:hypothetical protein
MEGNIGRMAHQLIDILAVEVKIPGYYLMNFFRFNIPAVDCFITEVKESTTIKSDYLLAEFPATLVYCVTNIFNDTVKSILLLRRKQREAQSKSAVVNSSVMNSNSKVEDGEGKISYTAFHRKVIQMNLMNVVIKETSITTKQLQEALQNFGGRIFLTLDEYIFNMYAKIVYFMGSVEHMSLLEAKDTLKKYFDTLATDMSIFSLEAKATENTNAIQDDETRQDSSYMVQIKDINWKLVNLSSRVYTANNFESAQAGFEMKEIIPDLETIFGKDKFFERTSMAFPLRFAVLGGSPELQIMCQNLGNIFEVVSILRIRISRPS